MSCIMLLVIICCRVMKNVVVVEYGINLGGETVSELVSSDSSFEGCIDDKLEVCVSQVPQRPAPHDILLP